MPYDPRRHHRRSIRLKGYDYTRAGAYFITIVTQGRVCLFGEVVGGEMRLNEYGKIVMETWNDLPNHVPNVELDAFVVMPNHVHGVIIITDDDRDDRGDDNDGDDHDVGAGSEPAPTPTTTATPTTPTIVPTAPTIPTTPTVPTAPTKRYGLPEIVRQFKTFSARRINQRRGILGVPVWQRNYYERIIRDERALDCIRRYIAENPLRWHLDHENPNRIGGDDELPF